MKLSLKLPEDQQWRHQNPLVTAKIPISIFNQPFLTSISTTPTVTTLTSPSSHLSFSLSSNFDSGPSLKLSYTPTSIASPPFSLSLKSGLGLFGSSNQSPLVFKAHFSFSSTNPTFSLHFKPQFGNFSLKKTTFSNPNGGRVSGSGSDCEVDKAHLGSGTHFNGGLGDGFVPEGSSVWQELKLEPCSGKKGVLDGGSKEGGFGVCSHGGVERALAWKESEKDGFLSGIAVMARTVFPLTKRVAVNMRWGVNFPSNLGSKMPYLTLNKVEIERVEEEKEEKKKSDESSASDLELLKGMCFWMRRDLELLEKENREMKQSLEQMKFGNSGKHFRGGSDNGGKVMQLPSSGESSTEFERWRNRKTVKEENGRRDSMKPSSNQTSDLESELEKAIKAASA